MGACTSQQTNDERDYMGNNMADTGPFGSLFDLHKAVCKIGSGSGSGTGFLCSFQIEGRVSDIYGLLTNSYILDSHDLSNPFKLTFEAFKGGKKTTSEYDINPLERFRFSCPILDATFVHFRKSEVQEFKSKGRLFLKLNTEWECQKGEEVLIIQQQAGFKTRFANGYFYRNHGLDILHTTSSEIGSWGSPLALKDGRVIGLHKRKSTQNTSQYDIATSAKAIVSALSIHCQSERIPVKLASNPSRFDPTSESRLMEHGLVKCANRDNRLLIFVKDEEYGKEEEAPKVQEKGNETPTNVSAGFKSSKSKYKVSEKVKSGKKDCPPTPISVSNILEVVWFVPTSHGWYWTPTDPFDRTKELNWMPVSIRIAVGGSDHNGKRVSRKDWEIAQWLLRTGNIQNRPKK